MYIMYLIKTKQKPALLFFLLFFYLTGFSVVDSDVPGKAGLVGESLETLFTLERCQVKMDIDMSHELMTLV